MDELRFTIEQNKRTMAALRIKIHAANNTLEAICEEGQIGGYDSQLWTEGHVALMVAEMSALIARQYALMQAYHMIEKTK